MDDACPALPDLLSARLRELGLSRKEVVLRMGYRNLNKGLRRLDAWRSGDVCPAGDQTERLGDALGVDRAVIHRASQRWQEEQLAEAARQRAEDPSYYAIIRLIPAIYVQRGIESRDRVAAQQEAAAMARHWKKRVALDCPDSSVVWLACDGSVERITQGNPPRMQFGNKTFLL